MPFPQFTDHHGAFLTELRPLLFATFVGPFWILKSSQLVRIARPRYRTGKSGSKNDKDTRSYRSSTAMGQIHSYAQLLVYYLLSPARDRSCLQDTCFTGYFVGQARAITIRALLSAETCQAYPQLGTDKKQLRNRRREYVRKGSVSWTSSAYTQHSATRQTRNSLWTRNGQSRSLNLQRMYPPHIPYYQH